MLVRILFSIVALAAAGPAAAQSQIGKSTSISVEVSGAVGGSSRSLRTGDGVFENERITTDARGIGQFEFLDATRLAVGPGSSVTLDRFVYDRNRKAGKVAIELGRGAFRFISGQSPSAAYQISTTAAAIGVRGTTFDLYVADNGALCVATLSGTVRVCPRGRDCRNLGATGQYLVVTPDRSYWRLDRWDGALLGTTFAVAMPFLADQARLAPAFRANEAAVARYRANAP
ncbi:MAG: FecR domain-containing protein [Bradyrhizobiaceae bacterium]|nr:FecR domain-containing protein [Bradyrhizobiaceae bacterium]